MTSQHNRPLADILRCDWPILLVLLLDFAFAAVMITRLPEHVPVHWNSSFEPDRYASRWTGAFLLPALASALYVYYLVGPRFSPKLQAKARDEMAYRVYRWLVVGGLAAVHVAVLTLTALFA